MVFIVFVALKIILAMTFIQKKMEGRALIIVKCFNDTDGKCLYIIEFKVVLLEFQFISDYMEHCNKYK